MYNIKQIYRIDDKITLISVTFSTNEYEKKSELSTGCSWFISHNKGIGKGTRNWWWNYNSFSRWSDQYLI